MERRKLLKIGLALTASAATSTAFRPALAQFGNVVDDIIFARPWLEPAVFVDFRRLSAALIELRIVYNGPNGYEAGDTFVSGVWDIWRQAFGQNPDAGFTVAQSQLVPMLDDRLADQLKDQMSSLLSDNGEHFIGWLGEIGVAPDSPLQTDFLRAQAFFSVAAAAFIAGGDLTAFADFTWVYPFC